MPTRGLLRKNGDMARTLGTRARVSHLPWLSCKPALALPDLLAAGQVRAKARELYVQTCGAKKYKSPQMQTTVTLFLLSTLQVADVFGSPSAPIGAQKARWDQEDEKEKAKARQARPVIPRLGSTWATAGPRP